MLITVIILLSLAVAAETLATRHLVNLHRHVADRKALVQQRVGERVRAPIAGTTQPARE